MNEKERSGFRETSDNRIRAGVRAVQTAMPTTKFRLSALTGACAILIAAGSASAEVVTFNFARVGQSLSYFWGADNENIGKQIVKARIFLSIDSFPGSDAANFFTDHSFPIEPEAGGTNAIVIWGSDFGWSGSGKFEVAFETTAFNGVFVPARFGAETPGFDFDGEILDGSRIEFEVVPAPASLGLAALGLAAAARRRR